MYVIIGAGPAGLYAAIKLWQAGIRDLVIYDPRAGNYTRPGHLSYSAFQKAEDGIGIYFWPYGQKGHIKDLEKQLYSQATRLGIRIENKRFIKLKEKDATAAGVIVADSDDREEFIASDYVFDCTGARRLVINDVNRLSAEPPFKLVTITEPPVTNNFLAYVKVGEESDWYRIDNHIGPNINLATMPPLDYARSVIKLRALGWNESALPFCYGAYFGKGKACIYFQAPDHLEKANYDLWVQTVLESYIKPVHYEHLPEKKPKPRFMSFSVEAKSLNRVSYKGKNLPTVIGLGDVQIDLDYKLAHGIYDGMKRIDALFSHLEIIDGNIYYFDPDEYLSTIEGLMRDHKEAIARSAERQRIAFVDAREPAKLKFKQAISLSEDRDEIVALKEILKEIEGRQAYDQATQKFALNHDPSNQIKAGVNPTHTTFIAQVNDIHVNLLSTLALLPVSFVKERNEAERLLIHLAVSFKNIGGALFKASRSNDAIDAYEKAVEIYNLPHIPSELDKTKFTLYSNLVIAYNKEKRLVEALAAAKIALDIYERCVEKPESKILEKIVFNYIKTQCTLVQESSLLSPSADLKTIDLHLKELMVRYKDAISPQNVALLTPLITSLESLITTRSSFDSTLDATHTERSDTPGSIGGHTEASEIISARTTLTVAVSDDATVKPEVETDLSKFSLFRASVNTQLTSAEEIIRSSLSS